MSDRYDLVILGGGTAGLVSAFIAAGIGARAALVERERTGGDCLWTGCVPSRTLIASAHLAHRMRHADRVGLAPVEPQIDFPRVMDRVHATIAEIEPHDSPERLRAAGLAVLGGGPRRPPTRRWCGACDARPLLSPAQPPTAATLRVRAVHTRTYLTRRGRVRAE